MYVILEISNSSAIENVFKKPERMEIIVQS